MLLNSCGVPKNYPDSITLEQWFDIEGVTNPEVALVQINGIDVDRADWKNIVLADGDEISLLYFLGDS